MAYTFVDTVERLFVGYLIKNRKELSSLIDLFTVPFNRFLQIRTILSSYACNERLLHIGIHCETINQFL
jgi:hypothetical protein